MFLHVSVSHSVHRGWFASVHAGMPPPTADTPPGADTPSGADPPRKRHPPGADTPHPPAADPPAADTPPRQRACWEIRSTRRRYASYCNAILLF